MQDLVPEDLDNLVGTVTAAEAVQKTPAAIRNWKRLGYLKPHGLDERNRPLYRLIDVLRTEQRTRHRAAKKHQAGAQ